MRIMVTGSPNPMAYPIVGFTWILANKEQADQAKGKALVDFLWNSLRVSRSGSCAVMSEARRDARP
jgi:hypothetical protein